MDVVADNLSQAYKFIWCWKAKQTSNKMWITYNYLIILHAINILETCIYSQTHCKWVGLFLNILKTHWHFGGTINVQCCINSISKPYDAMTDMQTSFYLNATAQWICWCSHSNSAYRSVGVTVMRLIKSQIHPTLLQCLQLFSLFRHLRKLMINQAIRQPT